MEHDDPETFSENLLALLFMNCQRNRPPRKCLLFGWQRRGGQIYCCNISCTKSTATTWKI